MGGRRWLTSFERNTVDLDLLHSCFETVVVDYEECRRTAGDTREDIQAERVEVEPFGPIVDCDTLNGYWILGVIGIGQHVEAAFARRVLHGALLKRN